MNWPGLLKWSLAHQDGTKKTDIPALSDEQKKWLEEALASTVIDEVKEMKKLITHIDTLTKDTKVHHQQRDTQIAEAIEDLISLLQNSDSAINFCKIGGPIQLYELIVDSHYSPDVRAAGCRMLAEATQNNHYVQDFSSKLEFCRLMKVIQEAEGSAPLAQAAISALSATLKGNNLVNKRIFISENGLGFLLNLLQKNKNEKVEAKALSILSDLLYFKSHLSYNILVVHDQNKIEEIGEDLRIFTHQVEQAENHIFEVLSSKIEPILSDHSHKNHFLRYSLVDCFKALLENQKREKKYIPHRWMFVITSLRAHCAEMEKLAAKDDFFEVEVSNLNDLFIKTDD